MVDRRRTPSWEAARTPTNEAERARRAFYMKRWRENGGHLIQLDADLRREFGITVADFRALEERQDGVCAICRKVNIANRRLAVDHDHTTNTVRGLLCNSCNRAVGFFNDDPRLLAAAIEYLLHPPFTTPERPPNG